MYSFSVGSLHVLCFFSSVVGQGNVRRLRERWPTRDSVVSLECG